MTVARTISLVKGKERINLTHDVTKLLIVVGIILKENYAQTIFKITITSGDNTGSETEITNLSSRFPAEVAF